MAAEQVAPPPIFYERRRRAVGNIHLVNFVFAILVVAIWSFWPAICAMTAAMRMQPVNANIVSEGTDQTQLELQRSVQKYFLIYGIYIPLEDIMFTQKLADANKDLEPALRKTCGSSRFALWLPLIVRIPLVGERSSEWCWNVPLKK